MVFSFDINDIVKGNIKTVDTCSQAVMMGITFTHWVWILRSKSNIWNYHRCNAELEKKSMSKSTGSSRKSSFLLCNMAVTNHMWPGADCGSGQELLIAKFRLKLKKVGKTTRPFRYDLNQIPYDYTVEVRNRFKRLDLIECLMNYGWMFMTLYRRQGSRPSPRKRNAKNQNGCLRRPYK